MFDYISTAYNDVAKFVEDRDFNLTMVAHESCNPEHVKKIEKSIAPAFSFWSNLFKDDLGLVIVCGTEKSYDWLEEQLIKYDISGAVPNEERRLAVGDIGMTGGGGVIQLNNKPTLFFWQVIGSKSTFSITGELKTPAHLFAHAAQGHVFNTPSLKMTDLPPWIIEGQSDYSALYSISSNFDQFLSHRKNFATTAYVPGVDTRKILAARDDRGWFKSLSEAPTPFEGIPIVDEYYSGLFCYEKLVSLIGFEKIREMLYKIIDGDNFDKAFYDAVGMHVLEFYRDMSYELAELSKRIVEK